MSYKFSLCRMTAALVCVALAPSTLAAQGVLRGKVLRDASRSPLAGAEVSIVDSDQRSVSDSTGAYALEDLPAGWTIVLVRKVGFMARRDTINVRGNGPTQRDFLLASTSTQLDTIRTVAAKKLYVSPALQAFEERRKNATSGYFIAEEELRKQDEKSLAGVIVQRAPGLTTMVGRAGTINLVSTRRECSGPAFNQKCTPCYVTTYVDGQLSYQSGNANVPPPDFQRLAVNEYAAVEFYPSSATAPMQYNVTGLGAACGVLLLWTRER